MKVYVKAFQKQSEIRQHAPTEWWRSSSLGSCMRGRLLSRLMAGEVLPEYDDTTLGIFQMGHITEESIIKDILKNPEWLIFTQGEMFSVDYNLKGHFDAVLINKITGECILLECKSRNSNAFKFATKEASMHYRMQAHSYMYMINTVGFKVTCNLNYLESKINNLKLNTVYEHKEERDLIEQEIIRLEKKLQAIKYVILKGMATPIKNTFDFNIKLNIKKAYILYVNKDTYETLEFEVLSNDTELEKAWQFEMDTLNSCWRTKQDPVKTDPSAWQSKYCQFCKAGICQSLDDKNVTKAMYDIYEKRTGLLVH